MATEWEYIELRGAVPVVDPYDWRKDYNSSSQTRTWSPIMRVHKGNSDLISLETLNDKGLSNSGSTTTTPNRGQKSGISDIVAKQPCLFFIQMMIPGQLYPSMWYNATASYVFDTHDDDSSPRSTDYLLGMYSDTAGYIKNLFTARPMFKGDRIHGGDNSNSGSRDSLAGMNVLAISLKDVPNIQSKVFHSEGVGSTHIPQATSSSYAMDYTNVPAVEQNTARDIFEIVTDTEFGTMIVVKKKCFLFMNCTYRTNTTATVAILRNTPRELSGRNPATFAAGNGMHQAFMTQVAHNTQLGAPTVAEIGETFILQGDSNTSTQYTARFHITAMELNEDFA